MDDKIDPLPDAGVNRILGLLEIIDDRGGREDIYRIAHELDYEFGDLLAVVKAAELLGFLTTPGGDALLLPLGKQVIDGDANVKKAIFKRQLEQVALINRIIEFLAQREGRSADKEEILAELSRLLPQEDPEKVFTTLLNWGRYAELFGYDPDEDRFYIDQM